MSTLTVQNLRRPGETASRDMRGVAASWLNMNGSGTIAIRDSQNVSSITDNGVGDYTKSFTSLMADAAYATAVNVAGTASIAATPWGRGSAIASPVLTGSYRGIVMSMGAGGATYTNCDADIVTMITHGDLA